MESILTCMQKVILVAFLSILFLLPSGCAQMGETAPEANRRHLRILRLYEPELVTDLDQMLFFDRPNRLTERRIP